MTAVIVQCRISSTRLHGKALMELGGKPVLAWTLAAMKKIPADEYYVATDYDSYKQLEPVATSCGWKIFAGPLDDVLERFCLLIKKIGADIVVRATADNPFLFYEAACDLLGEYKIRSAAGSSHGEIGTCDYITWQGLPHGSGIEIFNAHSLLCAATLTDSSYDHEHVGPALYNHSENFNSIFLPAPEKYNFPNYRTTIDTERDYRRAKQIVEVVCCASADEKNSQTVDASAISDIFTNCEDVFANAPFTTEQIVAALQLPQVERSVLLVPSVKKGQGTGHLRRCLNVAKEIRASVYVPDGATLPETHTLIEDALQSGLSHWQITSHFPNAGEYALIVTDCFVLDEDAALAFSKCAPLVGLDDGGDNSWYCNYLLDIIPGMTSEKRSANAICPEFITLPKNKQDRSPSAESGASVLVCFGGEDPAGLTLPVAEKFAKAGFNVTAIYEKNSVNEKCFSDYGSEKFDLYADDNFNKINFIASVPNLREELFRYDIVATHYGLTAYEAWSAGCAVITFATTELHRLLSEKYGFTCLAPEDVTAEKIEIIVKDAGATQNAVPLAEASSISEKSSASRLSITPIANEHSLGGFLQHLAYGRKMDCPICGAKDTSVSSHETPTASENTSQTKESVADAIVARTPNRTFRRCAKCGIVYMAWTEDCSHRKYSASYFADEYKAQYGKTYIEDFESIKVQCIRRMENISAIANTSAVDEAVPLANESATANSPSQAPSVLDIGCAYGPFLSAASDMGWYVYGTDISDDAVSYVKNTLGFHAVSAQFPSIDTFEVFGVEQFDCVTMWYVIEHFSNLAPVLEKVSALVKTGGVFAFATPSGEGVSAKYNHQQFFKQSPADHYTIWEPSRAAEILKKFGFAVEKIVSTGHHAERFPEVKEHGYTKDSSEFKSWTEFSIKNNLGDTFEIYCRKTISD